MIQTIMGYISNIGLMGKELGSKIVRDLVSKGCTKWKIMREMQKRENKPSLAYNTVMAWERGQFCADVHIPHLQQFRYEFYIQNGLDPFNG